MALILKIFALIVLMDQVKSDVSKNRTPFCETCSCVNETLINPDVNCSSALVLSKLYQEEMWFEKNNNISLMYNINSIDLSNLNMRELNDKFNKSNLKKMDLSRNGIEKISANVFENLQDMVELILSYNDINFLDENVFKGLHLDGFDYPLISLKILRLDHNNFHTLKIDVFQHIEMTLEELYLGGNPFKVLDQPSLTAITGIQRLKVLDLSSCGLQNLPQYFLHTPAYLVKLDLSLNQIESIPETLIDSKRLEELIIDGNPIKNLTSKNGFPITKTLKVLKMSNMPNLIEIGANSLGNLINLEELFIKNNNKLIKIDEKALVREEVETSIWPNLKKLDLSDNKLTHLNFTFLGRWESLTSLDLRGNPWTCECENQWMLDELIPIYLQLDPIGAKEIRCGAPIEMEKYKFFDLYASKSSMRCLDIYGNHPEKDGTMLVGMLIGILLGIPCVLFALYAYQRNWFGVFDKSPAAYSRQFYRAPSLNEEF
nr:leucine-rich repeat transmembrane protein FLRT3-like [Onthophagus taurus]